MQWQSQRREMFVKDTAASLWNFWGDAGIACWCSESLSARDERGLLERSSSFSSVLWLQRKAQISLAALFKWC